jgi:hypothetical protein
MRHTRFFFSSRSLLLALAGLAISGCASPSDTEIPAVPPVVQAEVTTAAPESAEPPAQDSPASQPSDSAAALKTALESKDYAAIEALMAQEFGFGLIASEGRTYAPAEFIVQLQESYLGPGAVQVDLTRDIRTEVGPDYQALVDSYAQTVYSSGWGETQTDTALLFLNEQGQWSGMLYMFEGLEAALLFAGAGTASSRGEQSSVESAQPEVAVDDQTLGPFQETLLAAITDQRDYAVLQALMGDPFVIGYWGSEGVELTPPAAAEELRSNMLPPEAYASYTLTGNLSELLEGQPPETMWGPDVRVVRAIHSTGWGPDGNAEAILFIAQRADSTYYWHGIVYAMRGF